MAEVLDRDNLFKALGNVKRNGGSPGIDGMTVEELPDYLKRNWPKIRTQLENGTYRPKPVKRVEIPKPGGGDTTAGYPHSVRPIYTAGITPGIAREMGYHLFEA